MNRSFNPKLKVDKILFQKVGITAKAPVETVTVMPEQYYLVITNL